MITIEKAKAWELVEYINALLEAIDVENEEILDYIDEGYDDFVKPIIDKLTEV